MQINKSYIHDKTILSLLFVNVTLFVIICLSVLLRLNTSSGETFVVQYRSNLGALQLKSGPASEIKVFILFALVVLVSSTVLSIKIYPHRRHVATVLLGMTPFILLLCLAISDRLIVSS